MEPHGGGDRRNSQDRAGRAMKLLSQIFPRFYSWFRAAIRRSRLESEMEDELAFHLESRTEHWMQRGIPRGEAARHAKAELGSRITQREKMRASLGLRLWDDLRADVRYATRMLAKSPGFTTVAVLSLALGIGANTAVFVLAKRVLLDRLAVPQAQQLRIFQWTAPKHNLVAHIWGDFDSSPGGKVTSHAFPYPLYRQLRSENRVLGDLFAFTDVGRITAIVGGEVIPISGEMVSGNYYQALGIQPALGRAIDPNDDATPSSGAVAVISNGFWVRRFGRSKSVIGSIIHLNGLPITVVGVNPPGFTGAANAHLSPDIFFPLSMQPEIVPNGPGSVLDDSALWWVCIMARTKPGEPIQSAQAAIETMFHSAVLASVKPTNGETVPHLILADGSRGLNASARMLAQPVYVLVALAGLVLLLACANIANLLLARSAARQREMGVRMALGAARTRIARQMLTESLLLSVAGGGVGFVFAYLGRNTLPDLLSPSWRLAGLHRHSDWRIFVFAAGVTILTGALFGAVPAWKATRTEIGRELTEQPPTATHRRKGLAGKSIICLQVALSTLLIVGAILFVRTLINLDSVNPGFRTHNLLLFTIRAPQVQSGHTHDHGAAEPGLPSAPKDVALFQRIEERLNAVPGVQSVTLSSNPLIAHNVSTDDFIRSDQPENRNKSHVAWDNAVGQTFFSTMGIPIVAGRGFAPTDTATATKVAVVNRTLARQYFSDTNPIGKKFRGYYVAENEPFQIVGICADTHYDSLRNPPPATYYVLYSQLSRVDGQMTFEVRTHVKPAGLIPAVRHAVQSVDKNLPLINVRSQAEQIDDTIQQEKLLAGLTAGFGILALVLACIGIYGIMAYTVARRTNEIGIRLALGAQTSEIFAMVLNETARMALVGIAAGLGVALLVTRSIQALLFGLKPYDPATLMGATLLLLGVALAAGFIPALRASRVQPMQALRHE